MQDFPAIIRSRSLSGGEVMKPPTYFLQFNVINLFNPKTGAFFKGPNRGLPRLIPDEIVALPFRDTILQLCLFTHRFNDEYSANRLRGWAVLMEEVKWDVEGEYDGVLPRHSIPFALFYTGLPVQPMHTDLGRLDGWIFWEQAQEFAQINEPSQYVTGMRVTPGQCEFVEHHWLFAYDEPGTGISFTLREEK